MKFSCSQQTLTKALNIVSKAVTIRTTIPILKGILLKVDDNGILTMSASDQQCCGGSGIHREKNKG